MLASLKGAELDNLFADPGFWPAVHQQPPEGGWRTWLMLGGRGSGKTFAGARWLNEQARKSGSLALVGPSLHDVREVMIEGPSGVRAITGPDVRPRYEPSRRRLLWDSGAIGHVLSAEDPESLRGPQFHAAWADEFCVWPHPAETLALLRMGLRMGDDPRLVVTTTPKPIAALRALKAEPSTVCGLSAPSSCNAENLAPGFLENLLEIYGGTRLAAQELEGLLVEDGEAALWRAAELAACRGARLERIVVAVDPPAGSAKPGGAACGVVVAGRAGNRAYVLADRSLGGRSPMGWAERAVAAAREFAAHAIVAEANQGGEMVRAVLAGANPPCP
ncbi:MAG: terminase large subunit domain-containing protein, partial [Caulobacteraceae bacterium]